MPASTPAASPDDTVSLLLAAELSPADVMRARALLEPIPKQEHTYSVVDRLQDADGMVYIAYRERDPNPGGLELPRGVGYVSVVEPTGRIRWEAPVRDVTGLSLDRERNLHVLTETARLTLAPDGREVARDDFGGASSLRWVDPSTGHVVSMTHARTLAASSAEALPAPLAGQVVEKATPSADRRALHVRTEKALFVLADGTIQGTWKVPARETHGRVTTWASRLLPLPDGNCLCEMKQRVERPSSQGWHAIGVAADLLDGLDGSGAGELPGTTGPLLEPRASLGVDEPLVSTLGTADAGHIRTFLRKIAPDGSLLWETERFAGQAVVDVAPDGTVFCAPADRGVGPTTPVYRVGEGGALLELARVPGTVRALWADDDAGAAWVFDGATLTHVPSEGPAKRAECPQGWTPDGRAADGRLFVRDATGTSEGLLDPRSGTVIRLTDPLIDNSILRVGELERVGSQMPARPPGTVEKEDDWIVIGGIKVPRQK